MAVTILCSGLYCNSERIFPQSFRDSGLCLHQVFWMTWRSFAPWLSKSAAAETAFSVVAPLEK